MSDYDRGPYTPSERPLSFETPYPRDIPPRRRNPAPVALVASVVILTVIVAGGGYLLYRNGVRGPNDAPRPVGAPVNDVRTIAPPQAQASDPGAGLAVYRDDGGAAPAAPTFAPPPEAPAARPQPAPLAAPRVVASADLPPVHAPTAAPESAVRPPVQPRAMVARIAPISPSYVRPAADGAPVVQIGAFSSKALAEKGWQAAAAAAPGAMAGKGKQVEGVDKDGTTLYRAAITGFTSHEQAQALCARLRAAGRNCFVR